MVATAVMLQIPEGIRNVIPDRANYRQYVCRDRAGVRQFQASRRSWAAARTGRSSRAARPCWEEQAGRYNYRGGKEHTGNPNRRSRGSSLV